MTELFYFPTSGITTWIFIPPLVAFIVSFFTAMGGISGAFILLPFQISVLNYTQPSVSATNHLFNVLAIPGGVWRYIKEKRMLWPLTWAIIIGTTPGVLIGSWVRIEYLPDSTHFKFFAALVLFYIGFRLIKDIFFQTNSDNQKENAACGSDFIISESCFLFRQVEFKFGNQQYFLSATRVYLLCFVVGIIGGIYGIGGGAIISPFLVTFFHLPVYAIAGACLMGTLATSIIGVISYQLLSHFYTGVSVAPDWYLGFLFGIGG